MNAVSIDALCDWITSHMHTGCAEVLLTSDASPDAGADDLSPYALFLIAVDRLSQRFGEPDVLDWTTSAVTAIAAPMAMWEFDYYQLALQFEERRSCEGNVTLKVLRLNQPIKGHLDE